MKKKEFKYKVVVNALPNGGADVILDNGDVIYLAPDQHLTTEFTLALNIADEIIFHEKPMTHQNIDKRQRRVV